MTTPANPPPGPVLAIAVFGDSASVALRRGDTPGGLAVAAETVGLSHSDRILPLVSRVMEAAACGPADLAGVAFEAGPGGFTSLRVACALAQGLAVALGIPVCPVGTLEAAAVSLALAQVPGPGVRAAVPACVFVANDARMGECYFGAYEVTVDPARNVASAAVLLEVACAGPAEVIDALRVLARRRPGLRFAGDAHRRHDGIASALVGLGIAPVDAHADAAAIAMLAAAPAAGWLDPADAAPRYVREKVALDVDEQRALRAART